MAEMEGLERSDSCVYQTLVIYVGIIRYISLNNFIGESLLTDKHYNRTVGIDAEIRKFLEQLRDSLNKNGVKHSLTDCVRYLVGYYRNHQEASA